MRTSKKLYSYSAVDTFIAEQLAPAGYEIVTVPGALVDGYICIAPDERHYNYIFRETALNEWSSAVTMQRRATLKESDLLDVERAALDDVGVTL